MSVLLVISTAFASMTLLGGIVGFFSHRETTRQSQAAQTWRTITHRGGVAARSPWHPPESDYNAPGLVRVYPQSQKPSTPASAATPAPTPALPTPTPAPDASAQPERPAPVSIVNPDDGSVSTVSASPELPMKLADEPTETEKEAVMNQLRKGSSQSKVILTVWGVKSGGSKKYKAARDRFQHYRQEAKANV